jgi:alkanesulfonate monooxygenase SsuD/methylene tetrahydromethanopterin reductase-like flavin-dependent oxidoreductase (luciferase family)
VINVSLHYDFRAPDFGAAPDAVYATALEQCAWGDRLGFSRVVISSHHGCEDNYGPSPVVAASAIAAVTTSMRIIPVIALPLYHPLHVAEDVAVLDLISRGRIDLMCVIGYVPSEYAMFGVTTSRRGALMEEGLAALRQAWTGEEFDFRGERVRVRPRPYQDRGPAIIVGGDSRPAARRAARLADAYAAMAGGDSWQHYADACVELGKPVPQRFRGQRAMFVHVTHDPDKAWAELGPHLLHVNNSYSLWMTAAQRSQSYSYASSIDDLRASEAFEVLTPDEAVAKAREWNGLMLDPLSGGIAPELAWSSLELVRDEVMPQLAA